MRNSRRFFSVIPEKHRLCFSCFSSLMFVLYLFVLLKLLVGGSMWMPLQLIMNTFPPTCRSHARSAKHGNSLSRDNLENGCVYTYIIYIYIYLDRFRRRFIATWDRSCQILADSILLCKLDPNTTLSNGILCHSFGSVRQVIT